jgi:uncharacterized membrane protein
LLLGLILILLSILDALHQDVALFFSQRAHRLVVRRFATGQQEGKNDERNEDRSTQEDFSL